jgi:DNA-3-methyladenine glycosylase II
MGEITTRTNDIEHARSCDPERGAFEPPHHPPLRKDLSNPRGVQTAIARDRRRTPRRPEAPPSSTPARAVGDGHELTIEPRAPFRLDLTAWALRRRSHNAVDRFDGSAYRRVLSIDDGAPVAVTVTQDDATSGPRLSVLLVGRAIDERTEHRARGALDRLLGLSVDLTPFAAMAERDPLLGPLALRLRGLRPPRFPTVFEAVVNGVACQQLSLDVGIHLLNRLTAAHGRPVSGEPAGPRAFPDPDRLAGLPPEELKRHGFSLSKARTIVETAGAIAAGELDLESLDRLDDRAAVDRLTALRGIGRWTAEYVLLRGLGRLHVFPGDDVGAHNKLRRFFDIEGSLDYDGVARLAARWRPYAGMVYFHLLLDSLSETGLVDARAAALATS